MSMYEYTIRAAFEDAKKDNYQHPAGLDPDMIAAECSDLVDAVDEMFPAIEGHPEEGRRAYVIQEAFVRAFEAGLAVGLEAGEEGITLPIHFDRATLAGLVQQVLRASES